MKKAFILIVLSIAVLGCIQAPEPVESTADFKDCGDSEDCIKAEMENCGKAVATRTEGDENVRLTVKLTVYGFEPEGKCRIEMKIEKLEAVSEEAKASLGIIGPMIQGQEIKCLVPPEKLSNMTGMNSENMDEYCSGTLMDMMGEAQQP